MAVWTHVALDEELRTAEYIKCRLVGHVDHRKKRLKSIGPKQRPAHTFMPTFCSSGILKNLVAEEQLPFEIKKSLVECGICFPGDIVIKAKVTIWGLRLHRMS